MSVLMLVKLGFRMNFHNKGVDLYLGTNYYGCGHFLNGFIVLNVDCGDVNMLFPCFTSSILYDNDVNIVAC